MSSERVAAVFDVLKKIRRIVDATHELAAQAIEEKRTLRIHLVDELGPPTSRGSTLLLRVIDERATLATQLEEIRRKLELVHIKLRTENLGEDARVTNRPHVTAPKPRAAKAGLKPRRKGSAS